MTIVQYHILSSNSLLNWVWVGAWIPAALVEVLVLAAVLDINGLVDVLWRKAHAVSNGFWGLAVDGAIIPADALPLVSPALLLLNACWLVDTEKVACLLPLIVADELPTGWVNNPWWAALAAVGRGLQAEREREQWLYCYWSCLYKPILNIV